MFSQLPEDDFLEVDSTRTPTSQATAYRESIFTLDSEEGQTPGGRPSTAALSSTSTSWVDEMNAELAEFDTLTSGLREGSVGTPYGASPPAWAMRTQQQQQQR